MKAEIAVELPDVAPENLLEGVKEVQVRLKTELPEKVPDTRLSVPVDIKRTGLNELVNHLLMQESAVAYDFIIDGRFLRTSLKLYLERNQISPENEIVIEYVESSRAPESLPSVDQPDWISCIDSFRTSKGRSLLLSGCYDELIRLWDSADRSVPLCEAKGHSAPVKAVRSVSSSRFVSASKDQSLRLWELVDGQQVDVVPLAVHENAHADSIDCLAVSAESAECRIASGAWNGSIKLWKVAACTGERAEDEKKAARKRSRTKRLPMCLQNESSLASHSQAVSALCWPHPLALYSASWDASVRHHDAAANSLVRTWNTPSAAFALAFSCPSNTIAVGHADRCVRLYDPRQQDDSIVAATLRGHTAAVVGVDFSTRDEHQVLSCSHDGSVRVWDIRASKALHVLDAADPHEHVLAVHCTDENLLVCGGSDTKLRFHRLQHSQ